MIKSLFSSAARIGRKQFWLVVISLLVVTIVMQALSYMLGDDPLGFALVPVAICIIVININNNAKRLHDFGRSGWWQLAPLPVVLIVGLVVAAIEASSPALALGLVALLYVALLAFWIAIGAIRGDAAANRFGPPPATAPQPVDAPA